MVGWDPVAWKASQRNLLALLDFFFFFLFSWHGRKERIVSNREDKTVQIKSILWPV